MRAMPGVRGLVFRAGRRLFVADDVQIVGEAVRCLGSPAQRQLHDDIGGDLA